MNDNPHARGKIGLFSALGIGIGGMVGGGIFAVQGEAILLAKEATPLAFVMGGILALVTAYSYLKLTLYFRDEGGAAVFIREAFGQNILTETVNLLLWLGYLVSISLYADAFGDHALALLGISQDNCWLKHVFATFAIAAPALLNLAGIGIIASTENVAVVIKLGILLFVVTAGLFTIDHLPALTVPIYTKPTRTLAGVAVASGFIFIAFQGFELIANAIRDIRRPTRTLPRAFFGSVILTGILYLLITVTVISVEPLQHIADIKETVLAEAARPVLGDTGYKLIAVAAMLSTLAAITVTLYGLNRLGHELARERELPAFMLAGGGWKPFLLRLVLFSSVAILLANTLYLNTTAILASGLFLLVFGVVNAAALELAKPIGANRWLPLFGMLSAFFALTALLGFAMHSLPNAALVLLDTMLAALMYRTFYRIHANRKRLERLPQRLHD